MKIRFKKGDPREGLVAEFNTARARDLIAAGAAEEVKSRSDAAESEPERKPAKKAGKSKKAD